MGQGATLLRGEEYKDFDAGVRLQKKVKKNDVKSQKEQTAKDAAARALDESTMLCQHCQRSIVREQWLHAHEQVCDESVERVLIAT